MNSDVLQKEPGWEYIETDSNENMQYRTIVTYGNIKYAMTDMLINPPAEFKEIIFKHFALKKDKILETIEQWKEMASKMNLPFDNSMVSSHNGHTIEQFTNNGLVNSFEIAIQELKMELDKLPNLS